MNRTSLLSKTCLIALLFFTAATSFAQTKGDTVKPGKSADPMVVNPGKANDGMAVKPSHPNNDINHPMVVMSDTAFLNKNIKDNQAEIKLAALGQEKGTSAAVKRVASIMKTDHTAILNDLLSIQKRHGKTNDELDKMPPDALPTGSNFDAAWAGQMLAMHEAKIAELETFIGLTKDAELKAAVMKAIPKIKKHSELLAQIPGAKEKAEKSRTRTI